MRRNIILAALLLLLAGNSAWAQIFPKRAPVPTGSRFFNGADKVDFGADLLLNVSGDISFGIWVKLSSTLGTNDLIVERGASGEAEADNSALFLNIQGVSNSWDLRYVHEFGAGSNELTTFSTNIKNDVWTYVALSRDTTAKTVKLWTATFGRPLALISTFPYTNQHTGGTGALTRFTLGQREGGDLPLNGANLAHVLFYNRSLSVVDHQHNMDGEITLYPLLDSSVWDLTDRSRLANHAIATNAVQKPDGPIIYRAFAPRRIWLPPPAGAARRLMIISGMLDRLSPRVESRRN
ncbi:hypothetical protein LCGC14_1975300 [marine sediment metagenome]|uniref:LamG-like jellyroll fold domain-containing protein n=1 Tax=marine sediment metagenome TaxID=412755 RepID=A0A0F9FAZ4_9ZZZZ